MPKVALRNLIFSTRTLLALCIVHGIGPVLPAEYQATELDTFEAGKGKLLYSLSPFPW
jgi:hypothetical protein